MRPTSFRVIAATSCLLFGAAAWHVGSHSSSAHAQTVKPAVSSSAAQAQLQSASATTSKSSTLPALEPVSPGSELYTAKRGEAIPTIARHFLGKTSYLNSSELADAIRAVNHMSDGSNIIKANQNILIPGILLAPITARTVPIAKDFEIRAVYLTGVMAGSPHGIRIIKQWRQVGGNAVVFDIKDSDGSVAIPFEHPLLGEHKVYLHDVPKFVNFLHSQNMHAIARIAIFRDEALVVAHPELAVQSRRNKTAWRENGKLVWTDPSNPKVQDYDIALAKHVAQLGVDEIQFDYVRFPAEGDQKDAQFVFQKDQPEAASDSSTGDKNKKDVILTTAQANTTPSKDVILTTAQAVGGTLPQPEAQPQSIGSHPASASANSSPEGAGCDSPGRKSRVASKPGNQSRRDGTDAPKPCLAKPAAPRGPQRSDVIAGFLKKAYSELHPTGVLLSLDVFGVMAWQRNVDLAHTGQDIVQMAQHCDILSPMIYPSHFFGMDNIARPGDEPAHFIGESMDRFELITKGSGVVIRPWLQAFHWRTKTYSPEYIKIQVETARAKGGIGFLFWNAANDYSKPFTAMPEMKAENFKPAPNSAQNNAGQNNAGPSNAGQTKDSSKPGPRYFRGDELPAPTVRASLTTK